MAFPEGRDAVRDVGQVAPPQPGRRDEGRPPQADERAPPRIDEAILVLGAQAGDWLDRRPLLSRRLGDQRIRQQLPALQAAHPFIDSGRVRSVLDGLAAKDGRGQGGHLRAADADVPAAKQIEKDHLVAEAAGAHVRGEPSLGK